jgi:hypothetical protein
MSTSPSESSALLRAKSDDAPLSSSDNPLLKYFRNRALRRMLLMHLPLLTFFGFLLKDQIELTIFVSHQAAQSVWPVWPATMFSTACVVLMAIMGLVRQGLRVADPTRHPSFKMLAEGQELQRLLEAAHQDLVFSPSVPAPPFVAGNLLVAGLHGEIKMDRLDRIRWVYPKTTEKKNLLVFVSDDDSKIETSSFVSDEVRDLFLVEIEPHLRGAVVGYDPRLEASWKQNPRKWIATVGALGKVIALETALALIPSIDAKKEN